MANSSNIAAAISHLNGNNKKPFDPLDPSFQAAAFDPTNGSGTADPPNKTKKPVTKIPVKEFYAQYMSSPAYKQRLSGVGITQQPSIQRMLNTKIVQNNGQGTGFREYSNGDYDINVDNQQLKNLKKDFGRSDTPENVLAHELSHQSRRLSTAEQLMFGTLNKSPEGKAVFNQYKKDGYPDDYGKFLNTTSDGGSDGLHDVRPYENKADLDALRYMMYKKGIYDTSKGNMTADDLNKAMADKDIKGSLMFNRLLKQFKPVDIINLNNMIASNKNQNNNSDNIV